MAKKKNELTSEKIQKAIIDIESKNDYIQSMADMNWKFYSAHRNAGFNDEQAMALLQQYIHIDLKNRGGK